MSLTNFFRNSSISFKEKLPPSEKTLTKFLRKIVIKISQKFQKLGIISRGLACIGSSLFLSDEEPTLETLDYTIQIGSTPTFLYFDLYLNSAYAAHYVCINLFYILI